VSGYQLRGGNVSNHQRVRLSRLLCVQRGSLAITAMNVQWTSDHVLKLIEIYGGNECPWNGHHADYKHRNKTADAWNSIVEAWRTPGRMVEAKVRSIRSQFMSKERRFTIVQGWMQESIMCTFQLGLLIDICHLYLILWNLAVSQYLIPLCVPGSKIIVLEMKYWTRTVVQRCQLAGFVCLFKYVIPVLELGLEN
jgi:hypothetical protein